VRAAEGHVPRQALLAAGLSNREAEELLAKLTAQERPDFELDPGQGLPAEHFAERFAAAVPGADTPPEL
jgi:hypothetical protein